MIPVNPPKKKSQPEVYYIGLKLRIPESISFSILKAMSGFFKWLWKIQE